MKEFEMRHIIIIISLLFSSASFADYPLSFNKAAPLLPKPHGNGYASHSFDDSTSIYEISSTHAGPQGRILDLAYRNTRLNNEGLDKFGLTLGGVIPNSNDDLIAFKSIIGFVHSRGYYDHTGEILATWVKNIGSYDIIILGGGYKFVSTKFSDAYPLIGYRRYVKGRYSFEAILPSHVKASHDLNDTLEIGVFSNLGSELVCVGEKEISDGELPDSVLGKYQTVRVGIESTIKVAENIEFTAKFGQSLARKITKDDNKVSKLDGNQNFAEVALNVSKF
ncbi:MAG: hypothetical protein HRU09_01050 [Oligoflexales bacterium]|nr:hypothetical protein [Oligoflexales bacterium]